MILPSSTVDQMFAPLENWTQHRQQNVCPFGHSGRNTVDDNVCPFVYSGRNTVDTNVCPLVILARCRCPMNAKEDEVTGWIVLDCVLHALEVCRV